MNENINQHQRLTSHRVQGYMIDEEWYKDETGTLRCDCRVLDPSGRLLYRHGRLEDAMASLQAYLDLQRTRARTSTES